METIQDLKKLKEAYIQEQVDSIIKSVTMSDDFTATRATCNAGHYGWDVKLHNNMPEVAAKLREQGFRVSSQVNHGVTDWTIVLK